MEFLTTYLQRGFGSMNKNDVEVLVFRILLEREQTAELIGLKGLSDYAISLRLQIPESKVKRLRYEVELKYPSVTKEEDKKNLLLNILHKVQYKQENKKIQLLVSDKMLRLYIADLLSQGGRFFDTSFNSNIVSIDIDDFCYLLTNVYTSTEVEDIICKAKESLSKQIKDFPTDTKDIFLFAAKSVLEGIGRAQCGDFAVEKFKESIEMIKNNKKYKQYKK